MTLRNPILDFGAFTMDLGKVPTGFFFVKSYGAVGGGVIDSTAAIQEALDAAAAADPAVVVFEPGATYAVSDNLWHYGKVSLMGNGAKLLLTAVPTRADWIGIGHNGYGSTTNDPVYGFITDLHFEASSSLASTISTMLAMRSAQDLTIERCTFTTNGKVTGRPIGGYNDSVYLNAGSMARRRITVKNNVFYMAAADGESIGFGPTSEDIHILDNLITGGAGDDLGLHGVNRAVVRGNIIEAYDGRIYISDSSHVVVTENTIRYSGAVTGMGIMVTSESVVTPAVCQFITITNNHIIYESTVLTVGYGIRINAGRDVLVRGNIIRNDGANGNGRIEVHNQTLATWVDPTGVDPAATPRSHRVHVLDNHLIGTNPGTIYINASPADEIYVDGNRALQASISASAGVHWGLNNHLTSGFAGLDNSLPAHTLFTAAVARAAGASYVKAAFGGAATDPYKWRVTRKARITGGFVSFATDLASGFYQLRIFKNGVQIGSTRTPQTVATTNFFTAAGTTTDTTLDVVPGDEIYVDMKTDNGLPTPNTIMVELHHMPY